MPSAPAIFFDWKPSRGWRAFRWGMLLIGAVCLLWSGLELLAKFALALLAGWLEWRNFRAEKAWDNSHWKLDGEGGWRWRVNDTEGAATLEQATLLGSLIVLNLRCASGRIDLPIWPDQLDADTRRGLRVRLATLSLAKEGV